MSETTQLIGWIRGQHIALSVAAAVARNQLSSGAGPSDAEQLSEMLNAVARAVSKVAPIYLKDSESGALRRLAESELDGATFQRGATLLVFPDGRSYSSLWLMRGDLREAIAILKGITKPEVATPATPGQTYGGRRPVMVKLPNDPAVLLEALSEVERLLYSPCGSGEVERAVSLITSIARHAPAGAIANAAMHLVSALAESPAQREMLSDGRVQSMVVRLRLALNAAVAAQGC